MDSASQETLQRVERNDTKLHVLHIGGEAISEYDDEGEFKSSESNDYTRLGTAIGTNTYIDTVYLCVCGNTLHDSIKTIHLLDGLKSNSSITKLILKLEPSSEPIVTYQLLRIYQEKDNLTKLGISHADLLNGVYDEIIATTLQCCTNLEVFDLIGCNITSEQLISMVEPIKHTLKELDLHGIGIGNTGCEALAGLLRDPFCVLKSLSLSRNNNSYAGVIAIANSLNCNSNLAELHLTVDDLDHLGAADTFSNLLCNTSSIDSIYSSNHTLETLTFKCFEKPPQQLLPLLIMNKGTNKHHVTIKKILRYHPNIDMSPLYELDSEGGEYNLKALPYLIAWFDEASKAVLDVGKRRHFSDDSSDYGEDSYDYQVDEQKLSALYQFVKTMPMLFVVYGMNQPKRKYSTLNMSQKYSAGSGANGWFKSKSKRELSKLRKYSTSRLSLADSDDSHHAKTSKRTSGAKDGWFQTKSKRSIKKMKNNTNPKRYTTEDIDREISMYKEQSSRSSSSSGDDDDSGRV